MQESYMSEAHYAKGIAIIVIIFMLCITAIFVMKKPEKNNGGISRSHKKHQQSSQPSEIKESPPPEYPYPNFTGKPSNRDEGLYTENSVWKEGGEGIPVTKGALKTTSEDYKRSSFARGSVYSPYLGLGFMTSVDYNAKGFEEIKTVPEPIGILTTVDEDDDTILELSRRDIAPYRDLYEYIARDKHGFVLKLPQNIYLEDGDIVDTIVGKESKGTWKATLYNENKYVYV